MIFSSTVFLFLFLPSVFIVYYNPFITGRRFRNSFLFAASLFFYAFGEPLFVLLLLLSVVMAYLFGLKLVGNTCQCKRWLQIGVVFHLGLLFIFKYLTFVLGQIGLLTGRLDGFHIALPLGISFFTFQILSYLFDIYYGRAKPQNDILHVGLYVMLFPQLIAGPIVRYNDIEAEIGERRETLVDFTEGMLRFIYGLAKKVLIADYMGQLADTIFALEGNLSVGTAWLGAVAYSLQIYFDFSGYSDMAIGLGRCFGFHFLENFNYPYVAQSATEFWRRWHISLGNWFRDYVYIPLGGNRCSNLRWGVNLIVVWSLTGIWHGANYTFWVWGLFYFVLLVFEKISKLPERLGVFAHVYALVVIILGWVMFRSENLYTGLRYIGMMFGIGSTSITDESFCMYLNQTFTVLATGVLLCVPVFPLLKERVGRIADTLEAVIAFVLFVLTLVVAVSASYNPFIYFNF